jgi:hypothetical protein
MNHRLLLEVAIHEAGHSVIARVLGLRAGGAALCDHDGVARAYFADDGSIENVLAVLACRAATEVLLGYASDSGCSVDDSQALALLEAGGREPWYAKVARRQVLGEQRQRNGDAATNSQPLWTAGTAWRSASAAACSTRYARLCPPYNHPACRVIASSWRLSAGAWRSSAR